MADTGQTPYTGAVVTDDLTSVLDDAAYNGDATATTGTVAYTSPILTWTGDLAPGATATISYTITVDSPDNGDKLLVNTVTSTAAGSTCPPSGPALTCTASVTDLIPALSITKTASVSTAVPGSAVDYTVTVADTGQTPYSGAVVTDDLTNVLGDAAYDGDATASTGTVAYASPTLTWTGNLTPGAPATITYSVTVSNPDTGSRILTNTATSAAAGSNCPVGTASSQCTASVAVIGGSLSITSPASASLGATTPGGTVGDSLGDVQVIDNRGFGADWTATVSSTDFTTGGGAPAETIPASDGTYAINGLTATGSATFSHVATVGLSGSPEAVVSATDVGGNTSVTWNPSLQIAVPGGAIVGTYSATITHSVS